MNQILSTPAQAATAALHSRSTSKKRRRVAVLSASWHRAIVEQARDACSASLQPTADIEHHDVPGAFELPLLAQTLARSGRFDAIVCCALVVNGGIYRHDFVAHAVIDGLMRVQLDTGVPVFSAVLTPHHFHEHEPHQRFFHAHFEEKGREVAGACLRMWAALDRLGEEPASALLS